MKRFMVLMFLVLAGCETSKESSESEINYLELCQRIEDYCLNKHVEDTDPMTLINIRIECNEDPCLYLIEANQIIANQDTDSIDYIDHDSNSLFFCRTNSMYSIIGKDIIKCHFITNNQ